MTLQQLKDCLYDVVAKYFAKAEVIWSESNSAKPPLPFVRIKTGSVVPGTFPITDTEGGKLTNFYPSKTVLEVNLYTVGEDLGVGEEEGDRVNTAVGDLLDFVSFINSPYVTDWTERLNITLMPTGPVRDVTALLNDTSHEYRAMVEISVEFLYESAGAAGVSPDWKPSPSGGGSDELASKETGYFEKVAIKEESKI